MPITKAHQIIRLNNPGINSFNLIPIIEDIR
jgi:hypothetical protein